MFFSNNFLTSAALIALAIDCSLAATLPSKRQTPATCSTSNTGYLTLSPLRAASPVTYAGIVSGVTHTGIDGNTDSLIVTKDTNGNPLAPQAWEFARCTDQNNDNVPGSVPPIDGPTSYIFGILRPANSTQHCLALESEADAATGSRNSIVDSYCTQVPAQYRTWVLVEGGYYSGPYPKNLYFQSQNTTVTIGTTAHAEVQFFTNQDKPGQEMQLILAPIPSA